MAFELTIDAVGIDFGNSVINVVAGMRDPKSRRRDLPVTWVEQPTIILSHVDENMTQNEMTVRELEASLDATIAHPLLANGGGRWRAGLAVARDKALGKLGDISEGGRKVESEPVLVSGLMSLGELAIKLGIQQAGSEAKLKKVAAGELKVTIRAVGASLPYSQHEADKDKLKAFLRKPFTLQFHGLSKLGDLKVAMNVDAVTTTSEGRAAVVAHVYTLNPAGQVVYRSAEHEALMREPLGALDVGGGTTDVLLFDVIVAQGGKRTWTLDPDRSKTIEYGINAALTAAVEKMEKDGWEKSIGNEAALTAFLRSGQRHLVDRSGPEAVQHEIMPYLKNQHMKLLADQINRLINEEWNREIGVFLLIGGGAQLVAECGLLKTKRKPVILEDAEWANAIGNYLLAVRLSQKQ